MSGNTKICAVVGNPIKHSKSPDIHHAFARAEHIDLEYLRIESPLDGFDATVRTFFSRPMHVGLNVTVPFKEEAFALADVLTDRACLAGAVNTLWRDAQGRLNGDTTDGAGLVRDMCVNNEWALRNKKVLIVGAGGAVKGVLQPILNEKPADIVICNRTAEKAEQLAVHFSALGNIRAVACSELVGPFDIVINGTSASLAGTLPPISERVIAGHTAVYDMMYAPQTTAFNAWALEHGAAAALDGLGMLVEQAAEAFALWHGVRPETGEILLNLRKA